MFRLFWARNTRRFDGRCLSLMAAVALMALASNLQFAPAEQGQITGIASVPEKLMENAKAHAKGVNWLVAYTFKNGSYRLLGTEEAGFNKVTINFDPDGALVDVRTFMAFNNLPEAVRN